MEQGKTKNYALELARTKKVINVWLCGYNQQNA